MTEEGLAIAVTLVFNQSLLTRYIFFAEFCLKVSKLFHCMYVKGQHEMLQHSDPELEVLLDLSEV